MQPARRDSPGAIENLAPDNRNPAASSRALARGDDLSLEIGDVAHVPGV
jgi:hypothetical protein